MNSNSAVATGAAGAGAVLSAPTIIYFCTLLHITPPDEAVAGTLGVFLIMGIHSVATYVKRYMDARLPPPGAPAVPVAPPAQ